MFDKLIESEPEGAEFKNRRKFFFMSTVVVGILFLTAVVISIYAQDFALGSESFELQAMLAPAEPTDPQPEPVKPRTAVAPTREHSDLPTRVINMARPDEFKYVPNAISTEPNKYLARPYDDFRISDTDSNPLGSGRPVNAGGPATSSFAEQPVAVEKEPIKEPPPVKDIPPPAKPPVQSGGVMNGKASYLPKPSYPAAAIAINAEGKVDVQILIDEQGKVVSAKAVSGHPLLRNSAEQAARSAKFTPTFLSNIPVKVTGVIVYNFSRN